MNKEDNKMPRETIASLKAKNAELETQNRKDKERGKQQNNTKA